jgi:spore germination protein YaaH
MLAGLCAVVLSLPAAPIKMSGWLVFYDGGESIASFEKHAKDMSTVSVDAILCDKTGAAIQRPWPSADQLGRIMKAAKKNGVKVLATAANADDSGFGPAGVETAIKDDASARLHADALCQIVDKLGMDGLDLDYESLKATDKDNFSKFVKVLANDLHAKGKLLAIALHPKEEEPGNWDGPQAQDYQAIGLAADFVRIMDYDQSWETSPAGPIASPDWVERVMKFAVSKIPANKLDLGIPAYGYDWVGSKGVSVTWTDFSGLVKAHGDAKRDPATQELVLKYGDHTVGFADGAASIPKYDICKKLGLNGLAVWRLGSEDDGLWDAFHQHRRR